MSSILIAALVCGMIALALNVVAIVWLLALRARECPGRFPAETADVEATADGVVAIRL